MINVITVYEQALTHRHVTNLDNVLPFSNMMLYYYHNNWIKSLISKESNIQLPIIYRISRPNSRVFHSNSFSLHSNSTILVHCRISAVQIHYSGFQIYGFFIRINIFFIQIHWNSAIFTILSFNLALYGLVTS